MITRAIAEVRRFYSAAPIATTLMALAIVASLFFGGRAALFWLNRPPLAEREQAVAAWMTPRYVARSWGLPREVVLDALGLTRPPDDGPMSIGQIAEIRGVPADKVIEDLEAAIAAFRNPESPAATRQQGGTAQ